MLAIINKMAWVYDPTLPHISKKERRERGRKNSGRGRRNAKPASPYQLIYKTIPITF